MKYLSLTVAALVVLLNISADAQEPGHLRHITVSGYAETWVEPDIAIWNVQIERSGQDLNELHDECDDELHRLLQKVVAQGIPADAIQAGAIRVKKHYEQDKYGNRKGFSHFSLWRTIEFEQVDIDKYEAMLRRLLSDANIEVNPSFRYSAVDSLRFQLRLQAVQNAHEKAIAMAAVLGTEVGLPLIISEFPITADRREVDGLARQSGIILHIEPKRRQFWRTVHVRFELKSSVPGS